MRRAGRGALRRCYVVAVVSGIVVILFGLFAPVVTQVFAFFPETLMSIPVGLVLLPIVGSAFAFVWKDGAFGLSVIVTFVVAVSDGVLLRDLVGILGAVIRLSDRCAG